MCQGGFNLQKWKTNSTVVQEMINRSDKWRLGPTQEDGGHVS